ncbi:MAG: CotH kinase family protein, partial [Bacteroidia bacterium]
MINKFSISLILIFFSFAVFSQLPEYGPAFLQDEVASIYITIDPDSMDAVLNSENWGIEREFPANFRYESTYGEDIVENIGLRLRGNTSLNAAKKSFKVSFNSFVQGNKWNGLEKLNLNGSQNDPSMIRAALCWNVIRRAGLPGSRTSFVKLFINDEYKGLYTNVEHIDEEFTSTYFPGSQYSSLFKCLYPATLEYLGPNDEDYNFIQFGRRPYDQKTNDYTNDYRELAEFIDILNNSTLSELPCRLERKFNVDNYLKYAALDVLMGNWDGYAYNKNNYYLAIDNRTGQVQYLAYDLDNTLGIDWLGQDWVERNALSWSNSSEGRPLFERLMEINQYQERYEYYLRLFAQTVLEPETIANISADMISLISEAAENDEYRTMDYGFSYEDFLNSLDSAWGNQVDYAINEFVFLRDSSALAQTSEQEITPMIQGGYMEQLSENAYCWVSGSTNENVNLILFTDEAGQNQFLSRQMLDDGVFPDEASGDGIYSCEVSPEIALEGNRLYYRFEIENINKIWPCEPRLHFLMDENTHFINEVMSRNTASIQDGEGNFSDWIEVYNSTSDVWNTDGYYLTDNIEFLNKWALPELQILPNQFHLFWANELEDLERNYCIFSLAAGGETIFLVRKEDDAYIMSQTLIIPNLQANQSYGPITDGG